MRKSVDGYALVMAAGRERAPDGDPASSGRGHADVAHDEAEPVDSIDCADSNMRDGPRSPWD